MDAIFKQKLLGLRHPQAPRTFGAALLGDTSWWGPLSETAPSLLSHVPGEVSERALVLESLERFAVDKTREEKTLVLKIPGGELHVHSEAPLEIPNFYGNAADLRAGLGLDPRLTDLVLCNKTPGKVQVLFVSERFRPWNEVALELKSGLESELRAGFPPRTAELFGRMIAAMKLSQEEVLLYPVEDSDELDFAPDVLALATFYRPEIIVTLGAKATARILKSTDRLSLVHGQFFPRQLADSYMVQVVPLFHPSIIETNQNMKKTAWADMQKVMKHLKKIP